MFSAGVSHNQPGKGQTIRQPATAQILIDSLDRFPNGWPTSFPEAVSNSSSQWRLNLQQIVLNGYLTRIGVSQIMFQWNLPTIVADYNDILSFTFDGTDYSTTLTGGWYNVDDMATMLQDQMNAVSPGATFTVTWDAEFGVFQFDAGAGHTCTFPVVAPPALKQEFRTYHTVGILGGIPAAQVVRGVTPTMVATRYIDICSTYLTKYQRIKDANTLPSNISSTCIARVFAVPLNSASLVHGALPLSDPQNPGSAPFVLTVDYTFPKQIAWNPDEAINNFDIELRDEDGDLVPYDPENHIMCEYNIVLLASED